MVATIVDLPQPPEPETAQMTGARCEDAAESAGTTEAGAAVVGGSVPVSPAATACCAQAGMAGGPVGTAESAGAGRAGGTACAGGTPPSEPSPAAKPSTSSSPSARLTPCTYPISIARGSSPYGAVTPVSSYARGSRGRRPCSASAFPQSSTRGPPVARGVPVSLSTKALGSIGKNRSGSAAPSPARPLPHIPCAAMTSVAPARNSPSISDGSSASTNTTTRPTRPSDVRRATVVRTSAGANGAAAIMAAPRREGNARAMATRPSKSPTRSTCAPASRLSTSRCSSP